MTVPVFDFARRHGHWLLGATGGRRRRTLALLALLAAGVVLASVTWQVIELRRQLQVQQQTVRQVAVAPVAAQAARLHAAVPLNEAERMRVNRVIRQLNTPWPLLLGVLEQAASPQVALLSIEPDIERGMVRVHAEGSSLDALLLHAEQVQRSPQVAHTLLLKIDHETSARGSAAPRLSYDMVLAR